MPEAVTTQHETLWIGVNRSAMVRVPYVVSSPEIADPVQPIDATNLASDIKVYIPGIKDYSGDLVWEANSQYYRPGELRDLLAMDGCHVYAERRMPMVGMRVAVEGEASVSMSAADPDGVQRVTIRVAPTAPMAVEGWSPDMSDGYMVGIKTDSEGMNIAQVMSSYGGRPLAMVVTSSTRRQGAASIPEEWRFNGGTGPFGTFYAAFNIDAYVAGTEDEEPVCTEAGRLAYRLDPYDLGRTLAGTELSGTYNVMLVIPTVYWGTRATGPWLYLSSAPSYRTMSGMVAYAHTATLPDSSTKVYPYIGIGVYEASTDGTRLLSASGQAPVGSMTYDELKALADALTPAGSSGFQMWNLHHWTLLKAMAYAVMGTKNCQWMLGNGPVSGSVAFTTGQSDRAGPYADSTSQYDKVFVENAWGSVWDFVGDAYLQDYVLHAGNSLGGAAIGDQPEVSGTTFPTATGDITEAYTTAQAWDVPKSTGTLPSDPSNPGARCLVNTGRRVILTGGSSWSSNPMTGIASAIANAGPTARYAYYGTRLSAFLDDYAVGLTDEAPATLSMSAPLTLSMGQSTPDEEEAEEPEENYGAEEETPEETDTIEEDMR